MVKLTPSGAAKAQCRECLGLERFDRNEIENCKGDTCHAGPCPLFPYRLGKRPPVKVFRAFCLQCMGGSAPLVRECETVTCPVHPYRMGNNPSRAGQGRDAAHMLKIRAKAHREKGFQAPETTIRAERNESATGGLLAGKTAVDAT